MQPRLIGMQLQGQSIGCGKCHGVAGQDMVFVIPFGPRIGLGQGAGAVEVVACAGHRKQPAGRDHVGVDLGHMVRGDMQHMIARRAVPHEIEIVVMGQIDRGGAVDRGLHVVGQGCPGQGDRDGEIRPAGKALIPVRGGQAQL